MSDHTVLVLDLDGTCIYTDTFQELLALALSQKPWLIFKALWWLITRGRPYAKEQLVHAIDLNPANLPYNEEFLREVYALSRNGHYVVLATGTHQMLAEKIARYLGFFREVIGTHNGINMTGHNKARTLVDRYGHQGFIYAGDSRKDRSVWACASDVWVVNPKLFVEGLGRRAALHPSRYRLFPRIFSRMRSILDALEPRMWVYNLTILFPVLLMGIPITVQLVSTLFALCLMTSGTSILRDLMKLDIHRKHSERSPFARGFIGPITGLVLGPILLALGLLIGTLVNPALLMLLVLWAILLIQDDGMISGISRIFSPTLIGFFIS